MLNLFDPKQLLRIASTVLGLLFRRPLAGTSVIPVLPTGEVVLVKRQDNGLWSLPGGFVDWGEEINQAVVRELKEETGLDVVRVHRLVGIYSSPRRDPRLHSICVAVAVEAEGEFQIQDKLEIDAVRAFAKEDIPMNALAHDHERHLRDYFSDITALA